MASIKFMVMYPRPQDIDTFEHLYQDEEVPIGDGLSSEYAATFETFEKLYQKEHAPVVRSGGIPLPVMGIRSTQIIEERDDAGEALVPVAGHLGLEPGHAVLDFVHLSDAANGEQHLTGDGRAEAGTAEPLRLELARI